MRPWVLHVDLDQFIAAVEVLRRPELAGVPLIVGGRGDPTERAVVSTASYEARAFGVRSGMPLKTAVRKIPDAVFLPVDGPAYDAASAVVMETLRAHEGAVVQVLGWDEAFVGIETPGDDVAQAVHWVARASALKHRIYNVSAPESWSALAWGEQLAALRPGFECRLVDKGEAPTIDLHAPVG